jgi:LysM repeat protein
MRKTLLIGIMACLLAYLNSQLLYTVKEGDTLRSIARRFCDSDSDYDEIMDANNLQSKLIFPGNQLLIPRDCD